MTRTGNVAAVCLLFGCARVSTLDNVSPFAQSGFACGDADRASATAEWTKLRTAFPYHLQTVAVSAPFPSGCRAVVVTEPPPDLSQDEIERTAPGILGTGTIQHHTVGYDGWTADLVFVIPPVTPHAIQEVVAGLYQVLFGTTYGVASVDTAAPAPTASGLHGRLDLSIRPGDLHRWLLANDTAKFIALPDGTPDEAVTFRTVLAGDEPHAYVDVTDGLVAWVIPRGAQVAHMRSVFRQFAIASDLIVGAIGAEKSVVVIARQRVADPLAIQPLRLETASLLASVDNAHLAQSYERNHLLATKLETGKDWAPIYLSRQLKDTEYGSVLDLADQVLKSYSNSGTTHYVNFAHTAPAEWPFAKPLPEAAGTNELRYNWNTANHTAAVRLQDLDVLWLRTTGALNVSYFDTSAATGAERPLGSFEEIGRQFFASAQEPLLIRVVQYNALYQIFRHFNLTPTTGDSEAIEPANPALLGGARAAIEKLRNTDHLPVLARIRASLAQAKRLDLFDVWTQIAATTSARLGKLTPNELETLANAIATARVSDDTSLVVALAYATLVRARLLLDVVEDGGLFDSYARSVTVTTGSWIHTPSIVLSWNDDSLGGVVGGHSLDEDVSRVTFDPRRKAAPLGVVPVSTIGPSDLDRLVIGSDGPTLAARTARPAREALQIALSPPSPRARWQPLPGDALPTTSYDVQIAKRSEEGYQVTFGNDGKRYEMSTAADVVDAVHQWNGHGKDRVRLSMIGFTPDEARGLTYAAELRSNAEFVGVLESRAGRPPTQLQLGRAEIQEPVVRNYADGSAVASIDVTIPTVKQSLGLKIKLFFKRWAPEMTERLEGTKSRITGLFAKLSGKTVEVHPTVFDLRKELKELIPEARIEIELRLEMVDQTIVNREELRRRLGTRRHAG